jgi:hypothetical protein
LTCICLLFKSCDVPTPPDSDDERDAPALTDVAPIRLEDSEEPQGMNGGEPEHDQEPGPEQPVTGRQKARAADSQLHPLEMLAKLCTRPPGGRAPPSWRYISAATCGRYFITTYYYTLLHFIEIIIAHY